MALMVVGLTSLAINVFLFVPALLGTFNTKLEAKPTAKPVSKKSANSSDGESSQMAILLLGLAVASASAAWGVIT
jgi:hypothetical protein